MAKVLKTILGRKGKDGGGGGAAVAPSAPRLGSTDEPDDRLQGERNVGRRVSISRSGRYKQRNRQRSGIWDNPQLVSDGDEPPADRQPPAAAAIDEDKENGDSVSVRSKDSLRSRGSSILQDTSQVAQEIMDLADQQLAEVAGSPTTLVTSL